MAHGQVSAIASLVETESRPSASTPRQVKLIKNRIHHKNLIFDFDHFKTHFFCVHPAGEILVQSSRGLDFEDAPRLRLVVKAATVSSTSFMAINLILQDVNDNLPRFQLQNYVAYMKEAQGYEMPIIQVHKKLKP